jgi:hypothetical protein
VVWSVVVTSANMGSKIRRRMTTQQAQHQVATDRMRAPDLCCVGYRTDKLLNAKWFKNLGCVLSDEYNL